MTNWTYFLLVGGMVIVFLFALYQPSSSTVCLYVEKKYDGSYEMWQRIECDKLDFIGKGK